MRINRLNIGEEVRKKVDENGLSKAKFAELLGIARQNIEKTVFQKHSLDTDLLCNISEVLNCNFFNYYRPDNSCNKKDYTEQKEIKATLSIDQVQQIIDLPYKQNARNGGQPVFNLAKDLFILSFAMMGMNSADFYNAPTAENEIITYQRTKTRTRREDKAEMKVRIEPEIKSLFEKYSDPSGEKVFIFHKWYRSSENFNKSINKGLDEIGKIIEVPDLNYYYARHTMATLAANKAGIDIARVDEMLNHSDSTLKLARVYIERDYSVLWEANRKLLSLFKWDGLK